MLTLFSRKKRFCDAFGSSRPIADFFSKIHPMGQVFEVYIAASRCEFHLYKTPRYDQDVKMWVLGYEIEEELSQLCVDEATGDAFLLMKNGLTRDSGLVRLSFGLEEFVGLAKSRH